MISAATKSKIQMFGAWCAIGYLVVLFIGWYPIAGFLPPTPPSASVNEVGQLFQMDYTRIRIGMVGIMISALVFIPFVAVTSQYISRIEGGAGVLTYTFLIGGVGNMVLTFYPAIWWLVAAFRPDRAPDLIYLMNDMAWLQFIGGVSMYDALPLSLIIATFFDKSANPVFPRWFGWYNLWTMVVVFPDMLLFFFHTGPFAWDGLFGFWIPLSGFGSSFFVIFFVLRKAILRERQGLRA